LAIVVSVLLRITDSAYPFLNDSLVTITVKYSCTEYGQFHNILVTIVANFDIFHLVSILDIIITNGLTLILNVTSNT